MSAAKGKITTPTVLAEFTADEIVDSVVLSGIRNSSVTIVDTIVQDLPESVQTDSAIQRIVSEIDRLEKSYLPLTQDLHTRGALSNPARYVLGLGVGLLITGVAAGISDFVGLIVALALIAALAFYIVVQMRVAQGIRKDINNLRRVLTAKIQELQQRQAALAKES